ncbi:MAG: FAD binding domain-containing protein [Anaerolineae bacterium]|nr:FAD binding domain-containing protein [Anaerolineae bacterium]
MLRNVKTYYRPTRIEEAVILAQSSPNAVYLGGGAWTVAQGSTQLETVVDLQSLPLNEIKGELEGIQIGATATLQGIIDHPDTCAFADGILAQAAMYTQSRNLREQGTLGGTLIVAGPADPLTTVLLVLDSEVHYLDPALHKVPFTSFVAYRDRLINTRVLVTQVYIKRPKRRHAAAFEVVGRSPKDKPIVCAAAYITVEEGLPAEICIAVGGADARPARLHKMEHLLKRQLLTEEKVVQALTVGLTQLTPFDDFRGSAEYRLAMAEVLVRRAVLGAWERARRA